jgi:hypothetical protein
MPQQARHMRRSGMRNGERLCRRFSPGRGMPSCSDSERDHHPAATTVTIKPLRLDVLTHSVVVLRAPPAWPKEKPPICVGQRLRLAARPWDLTELFPARRTGMQQQKRKARPQA